MKILSFLILASYCCFQGQSRPNGEKSLWAQLEKENECVVNEIASNLTKPCQFPFIYENQTFYGCTRFGQNGNPWCSTKINPLTYDHIDGKNFYGYCIEDLCSTDDEGAESYEKFLKIKTGMYKYFRLMPRILKGKNV